MLGISRLFLRGESNLASDSTTGKDSEGSLEAVPEQGGLSDEDPDRHKDDTKDNIIITAVCFFFLWMFFGRW